MNSYPDDYVVHNLPLVILTGLEPNGRAETPFVEKSFQFLGDGGFRTRAELPSLHHPLTADLRAALLAHDQSNAPWRSRSIDKTDQAHAFKIRSVGRVGQTSKTTFKRPLLTDSGNHVPSTKGTTSSTCTTIWTN